MARQTMVGVQGDGNLTMLMVEPVEEGTPEADLCRMAQALADQGASIVLLLDAPVTHAEAMLCVINDVLIPEVYPLVRWWKTA